MSTRPRPVFWDRARDVPCSCIIAPCAFTMCLGQLVESLASAISVTWKQKKIIAFPAHMILIYVWCEQCVAHTIYLYLRYLFYINNGISRSCRSFYITTFRYFLYWHRQVIHNRFRYFRAFILDSYCRLHKKPVVISYSSLPELPLNRLRIKHHQRWIKQQTGSDSTLTLSVLNQW